MDYEKDFYQYLTGDEETNGYKIEYMSGPNIVSFGMQFGDFPYSYNWGGQNLSRWDYMNKLIDFVEDKINLDAFFHVYFMKIIAKHNKDESNQLNFFKDINKRLLSYGQKITIKNKNIIVENVKQETVLDNIDLDLSATEEKTNNDIVGDGGFANIFNTEDPNVLRKELKNLGIRNKKEKQRFEEEFRQLKLIANPKFIIPVFEYDEINYTYTMQKTGGSFQDLQNTLDDQEIITFFYQLGEAIEYIHSKKIYHRDIKESNCLKLNRRWVLCDFGLSKDTNTPSITSTQSAWGTEGYIHPDILNDLSNWKNYKPKYDYYSYGKTIINNFNLIKSENYKHELLKIGENLMKANSEEDLSSCIKQIKEIFTKI